MRRVTIKDVAKVAGVSYSTVSRALSGSLEIREETRELIMKVCKDMNYTPNIVAKSMVMKNTNLLGVIMPSVNNPFMAELAYHIDKQAGGRNYNIILCNSSGSAEQEEKLCRLLIGRQVDGLVICPSGSDSYERLQPLIAGIPSVFIGENLKDTQENYVTVDNFKGACIGVDYLFELGHRDILYFGRRKNSSTHTARAEGYLEACRQHGLTPRFCNNAFGKTSTLKGYQLAAELFSNKPDFTAILAATDTMALGVMQAAEEAGIDIPGDISLMGFDNVRDSDLPGIHLTTIAQPIQMIASFAVDNLLDQIAEESMGYFQRVISPRLIERKTCRHI